MIRRSILLWGLLFLFLGAALASHYFGQAVEVASQAGWTAYTAENSNLTDNRITSISIDRQDRAWISTCGGGVNVFDGETWTDLTTRFVFDCVQVIALSPDGQPWIGGSDNRCLVSTLYGKTWICYNPFVAGEVFIRVNALALDGQGQTWVGVLYFGLSLFDGERWINYTEDNSGLGNDVITAIAFAEQGEVWIGTEGGVFIFNDDRWINYTEENSGLADNRVRAIAFDELWRAWVGTASGGVSVFDGEVWTNYNTDNSGLPTNCISEIVINPQSEAWIATCGRGVVVFDGDTWINYAMYNSGLTGDNASALAFDSQNRGWIGSWGQGITIVTLDEIDRELPAFSTIFRSPIARWLLPLFVLGLWVHALLAMREEEYAAVEILRQKDWIFWIAWVLISVLALGAGLQANIRIMGSSPGEAFAGIVPVLCLVVCQYLVIAFMTSLADKWLRASLLGLIPGLVVALAVWISTALSAPGCSFELIGSGSIFNCNPTAEAVVNAATGAAFGVVVSAVQSLCLRKNLAQAGWWFLAAGPAWIFIGAVWASTGLAGGVLVGATSGAVYGSITGSVLIRMLRTGI